MTDIDEGEGARVYDLLSFKMRKLDPLDVTDPYLDEAMAALRRARELDPDDVEFGAWAAEGFAGEENSDPPSLVGPSWEEPQEW